MHDARGHPADFHYSIEDSQEYIAEDIGRCRNMRETLLTSLIVVQASEGDIEVHNCAKSDLISRIHGLKLQIDDLREQAHEPPLLEIPTEYQRAAHKFRGEAFPLLRLEFDTDFYSVHISIR